MDGIHKLKMADLKAMRWHSWQLLYCCQWYTCRKVCQPELGSPPPDTSMPMLLSTNNLSWQQVAGDTAQVTAHRSTTHICAYSLTSPIYHASSLYSYDVVLSYSGWNANVHKFGTTYDGSGWYTSTLVYTTRLCKAATNFRQASDCSSQLKAILASH